MFRRNSAPRIGHADRGTPSEEDSSTRTVPAVPGLRVQRVQQHPVNLIAICSTDRQGRIVVQFNLNRFRDYLLPRQHDGVFDGRVQIAWPDFWGMGASGLQ